MQKTFTRIDLAVDVIASFLIATVIFWSKVGSSHIEAVQCVFVAAVMAVIYGAIDLLFRKGWRYASASAVATFVGALAGGLACAALAS